MTVTISKRAVQAFGQNGDNCRQFLQSKQNDSYGSYTVEDVGETFRLTGSYESIKHIRKELTEKMFAATAGDQRQPQANSTQKVGDDVGGVDVRATPFTSHKTPQGAVDKHSQTTEGQLSPEVTMQEPSQKPKRIRKLKSATPDHTSEEAAAQEGLAERTVDDGRVLEEETKKLIKRGDYVSIEVDRDRHHYLITNFQDELKKQLPPFLAFEDEKGKHKVAFMLNSKKNNGKAITAKYNSCLSRFLFEVCKVPDGVDGSVLRSIVTAHDDKDSAFILDDNNKLYKLIGEKNNVDRMKKLIDEHLSEQRKPSKDSEDPWQEVLHHAKRKVKKASSTSSFCMEHGKLNRCDSSQSLAAKSCSLQVSLFESKTKAPATETIVRAVDSKMQRFGDAKAAIEFESVKKYKDECLKIANEYHNTIPVGHITTTGDFQKKTKIKNIVHVVLEEKKVPAVASDVAMKEIIYRCLHHAENALQTKSIILPHLGGSGN